MTITTKFEIGQKVWRNLHHHPDGPVKIRGIIIEIGESWKDGKEHKTPEISYSPGGMREEWLYASKEEARAATLEMIVSWKKDVERL